MDSKIDCHLKALFLTIEIEASGKKKVKERMREITIKIMGKTKMMMTKKKMIFMQEIDSILLRIITKTKNSNSN